MPPEIRPVVAEQRAARDHCAVDLALYELDSYAAMDTQAALGRDPDSEWSKLQTDWSAFWDLDLAAPWSNTLPKDGNDATIFDPQT